LTAPDDKEMVSKKICVDRDRMSYRNEERKRDKLRKESSRLEYIQRR
jgi:hypothetical protein